MSTFAIVAGLSKHGDKTALARAATGLLILIFGAAVRHDTLGESGESGERLITVAGSLLVAISHLRNLQLCQFRVPSFSFK
jgi:hypothetical protein